TIRHSALSTQHSVLSTQYLALFSHSALFSSLESRDAARRAPDATRGSPCQVKLSALRLFPPRLARQSNAAPPHALFVRRLLPIRATPHQAPPAPQPAHPSALPLQ